MRNVCHDVVFRGIGKHAHLFFEGFNPPVGRRKLRFELFRLIQVRVPSFDFSSYVP